MNRGTIAGAEQFWKSKETLIMTMGLENYVNADIKVWLRFPVFSPSVG